jgi:UDP-glucose 4-epimerase
VIKQEKHRFAITGGAGFIGSHFTAELLNLGHSVLAIDNLCSGTKEHLMPFLANSNFTFEHMNVEDSEKLTFILKEIDTVIHLASNPDIAKSVTEPRIDFVQGTALTESVAESARRANVKNILYASGSGVYGDAGNATLSESSEVNPISTYGASKLAGEALLSSYSFMFGIRVLSFRFANVVGGMQTHGVGYDFLIKLKKDPNKLEILGDGNQSKSYIHVNDVISGVLTAFSKSTKHSDVFNVSTSDILSVNDIALLAIEVSGLDPNRVNFNFTGGDRGWKADIPVVCLNSNKLIALGWRPKFSSRQAMKNALIAMKELQ